MVIALGDRTGQEKVAAIDSNSQLLTHVERLDELFHRGLHFEAAVSQMAIVEALLLFYLRSRIQADHLEIKEDLEKIWAAKKLTFGKVKSIVIDNAVLHDSSIQAELEEYVTYRNDLAHNLISTFNSIDLERFYEIGNALIGYFHNYLLQIVKGHET